MSKDRILINGEWYVKENNIKPLITPEDVTYSIKCDWENDDWFFEAISALKGNEIDVNDRCDDFDIIVTDKRIKGNENWVEHMIDNRHWVIGVLEGNETSMVEANEMFDSEGLEYFRAFVSYLIGIGWLRR